MVAPSSVLRPLSSGPVAPSARCGDRRRAAPVPRAEARVFAHRVQQRIETTRRGQHQHVALLTGFALERVERGVDMAEFELGHGVSDASVRVGFGSAQFVCESQDLFRLRQLLQSDQELSLPFQESDRVGLFDQTPLDLAGPPSAP